MKWCTTQSLLLAGACCMTLLVSGCNTTPYTPSNQGGGWTTNDTSRYTQSQDSGPEQHPGELQHDDPTPQEEPRSKYGNPASYSEFGVTYRVLDSASGYREDGVASWYGKKFHGHRTSSGETYDMYKLSAAHKTLPLPSWVRVTNLDNGSSTVVRVNDRGPFHGGRLIDLSWAAAVKLGIDKSGTGRVRVEAVSAAAPVTASASTSTSGAGSTTRPAAINSPPPPGLFLQAGAFRELDSARNLASDIMLRSALPVSLREDGALYRVWVGPFADDSSRGSAKAQLTGLGFATPVNVATP